MMGPLVTRGDSLDGFGGFFEVEDVFASILPGLNARHFGDVGYDGLEGDLVA
jgi:hypothetical protein